MMQHVHDPLYLEIPADSLLGMAYEVSEWAITFLGPIFWFCLFYQLLVAQLS